MKMKYGLRELHESLAEGYRLGVIEGEGAGFLRTRMQPGTAVKAQLLIDEAAQLGISVDSLRQGRHRLGIEVVKFREWIWVWVRLPFVEEDDPYPWRTDAREREGAAR